VKKRNLMSTIAFIMFPIHLTTYPGIILTQTHKKHTLKLTLKNDHVEPGNTSKLPKIDLKAI
jgi:hypothetical protein